MKRNLKIGISILFGILFLIFMMPFQFDRYIPVFHSVVSIVLNIASGFVFSIILYRIMNKSLLCEGINVLLYFLVILGAAHSIYTVMFWSSLICLIIILIILIFTGVLLIKNKIKSKHIL